MQTIRGLLVLGILGMAAPAMAQTPAQDVTAAMQGQLGAEVTPGEGRLLACLYAHGDKLSGTCAFTLYDAAARLERAISAITYVASECRAERETHCANVEVGEGRVAQCLKDHASDLSAGCGQALSNVGVQ
jgi:Cysteine rich repeat